MSRPFKNYLGVKIYKIKTLVCGSEYRDTIHGNLVPCKPQFDVSYEYDDSYPYSTLDECMQSIDHILGRSKECGGVTDPTTFAAIMNGDVTC